MNLNEARAWLMGERSWCNVIPQDPHDTWQTRIAKADAASTEQAYWVARAHKEGLVNRADRIEREANTVVYPYYEAKEES